MRLAEAATAALLAASCLAPASAASGRAPEGVEGVALTSDDGSAVTKAIGDRFVRPMLKVEAGRPTPPFSWGKRDVTGDGYGELFLVFTGMEGCSDAGCPMVVMARKPDGAWRAVLQAVATWVGAVPRGKAADVVVQGRPGDFATYAWDRSRGEMRRQAGPAGAP